MMKRHTPPTLNSAQFPLRTVSTPPHGVGSSASAHSASGIGERSRGLQRLYETVGDEQWLGREDSK